MGANADLARRWFKEVWNAPRRDATIDELMSPDCQIFGVNADGPIGREDLKAIRSHVISRVPDVAIEMTHVYDLPTGVAFHGRVTGVHGETGSRIDFSGSAIIEIRDGQVCQSHETWDFLGMMDQIGAVDRGAVARELTGAQDVDHRKVLETWFQRVWTEEDPSAIDEMFPDDGEAEGLGEETRVGPKGFREFQQELLSRVAEIRIDIEQCMQAGEWMASRCMLRGKCRATGKPVEMSGQCYGRFADGKILMAYNHWDFIGLFQQLGLMPDDAMARCLGGERID